VRTPRPRTLIAIAAAVLLTATGAADLTLEHVAQNRIAERFDCRLHPQAGTSVALTDTLAGLDLLTGRVGTVRIDARGITKHDMRMNLNVQLDDVTDKGATSGGTATATVPLPELQQRIPGAAGGATLGTQDGNLAITTTAGGIDVPVTVLAAVTTTTDSLVITPQTLDLMGHEIPVSALAGSAAPSAMTARLQPHTMPLHGLAPGTRLASAGVGPDGLALHLTLDRDATAHASGPPSNGSASLAGCGTTGTH
jgi:hypothetical protein